MAYIHLVWVQFPVRQQKLLKQMKATEVYKQLLKSKVMAKFSHYCSGNLYYTVQLEDGIYQFPIKTIEGVETKTGQKLPLIKLSSDLGTTSFEVKIKGASLNRWISKAIENDEFIKII
jgi:hypothetical protein